MAPGNNPGPRRKGSAVVSVWRVRQMSISALLCFCPSEAQVNIMSKVPIKLLQDKWDLGRNLSEIQEQSCN